MYNLIRFYNQNRKKIFRIILIIASIIGLIQLLNYFAEKNVEIKSEENIIQTPINTTTSSLTSDKSAVSGDRISNTKLTKANNVIDNFITYCNTGEVKKAYNLLTQDCKEDVYPTLQEFEQNYYLKIFNGEKKSYSMENWIKDTYVVRITDNILATGKISDSSIQDYITVKKEDDEEKISINSYIGKEQINKTTERQNMKITVVSKNTYMDYEIYNIKIENNSNKDILLDNKESTKTIYLEDSKNSKYVAQSHEILKEDLLIREGHTKNLSIKFMNTYSITRNIKYLVFSKAILDNEEYEKIEDKSQYNDTYKLEINV